MTDEPRCCDCKNMTLRGDCIAARRYSRDYAATANDTISRYEGTILWPEDRNAFMRAFEDTTPNKKLVDLMSLHNRVVAARR